MTETATNALPPGYAGLVPLSREAHADLRFRADAPGAGVERLAAIPLLADEFAAAQRDHPILFSQSNPPAAAALTALDPAEAGVAAGAYRPLWLRRYPFALALEAPGSERHVLCADLSAPHFAEARESDPPVFVAGEPGPEAQAALLRCREFEAAAARSRAALAELAKLDLFEPAQVEMTRSDGPPARAQGFRMLSEQRLRDLDDETLAALARRGLVALAAAHFFSLSRFAGLMGAAS